MNEFAGYPLVSCPTCCASELVTIVAPVKPERLFGPGEWAFYACDWCEVTWKAIVPEPPDRYEGDGVYAENH